MLADKMISLRALLFDQLWVEWVDNPMDYVFMLLLKNYSPIVICPTTSVRCNTLL
jgi:hypothetical protein